jgi:RNA-directed DNA polymerase
MSLRLPHKIRPIHIPIGDLKVIQRRILTRLFKDFAPHPCSFGGIKGKSAADNAAAHKGKRFLAKIDIRDFYPSVHHSWVQHFFEHDLRCSPPVANFLRRLLTFRSGLPQGTCTSPALSDQLMRRIDARVALPLRERGIGYTRFVDDITLSAEFSLRRTIRFVINVIRDYGLHVNHHKTNHFGPDDSPIVTGYDRRRAVLVPRNYIHSVSAELRTAELYVKGESQQPPPYGEATYWGIITYIRRTNRKAAAQLTRQFERVNWLILEPLHLPAKRAKVSNIRNQP